MTPRTAVTWYSDNYLIFPTHRHRTFYSKASRVIFGYARAFMACNQILLANRDLGAIRHSTPAGCWLALTCLTAVAIHVSIRAPPAWLRWRTGRCGGCRPLCSHGRVLPAYWAANIRYAHCYLARWTAG